MAEDQIISFIPENDLEFQKILKKIGKQISDFRIPFNLIGNHWYRGNRKIFSLKSEGLYPVYGGFNPTEKVPFLGQLTTKREKAEVLKSEEFGFIFPMMKRTGVLEKSLSNRSSAFAVFFAGRSELVMGTDVPYAKFHQSDKLPRKILPQRKIIFIDGGPAEIAQDAFISGRAEAWNKIIVEYAAQVLTGEVA